MWSTLHFYNEQARPSKRSWIGILKLIRKELKNYILLWEKDTSADLYKLNKSIIISKEMQNNGNFLPIWYFL